MDLLTNAISSVRLGLEDYQTGNSDRMLSAVRNVHAGVLLLYKEILRRKSPANSNDVLLKSNIRPEIDGAGRLVFVGVGKKTVDVFQIKERFRGLGIKTDFNLLHKITEARNELEHYAPTHSKAALEGLITDAFSIVRDFITRELAEDPLQVLGEEAWQAMLDISTVYEEERVACEAAMKSIDWQSDALEEGLFCLSCRECASALLRPIDEAGETLIECARCGATESRDSYAPKAIRVSLEDDAYMAMKDGDDDPFTFCPECGEEAYVMSERRCAACLHEAQHDCERCGTDIPASEMGSSPYCGYCQYMYEKMLKE